MEAQRIYKFAGHQTEINCTWWSSYADEQSNLNNCELGRLYATDLILPEQLYQYNSVFLGRMKDIEVSNQYYYFEICSLMCCEKLDCDAAIFILKTQSCFSISCDKNKNICNKIIEQMNQTNSYKDSENNASAYMSLVSKNETKHVSKRDIFLTPNILNPTISTNIQFDNVRDEKNLQNSIIDKIIAAEQNILNETESENSKVRREILKRQNILKLIENESDKDRANNMLDVKKNSKNIETTKSLKSPLIAGTILGLLGLIGIVCGVLINWKKLCSSRNKDSDENLIAN
ncbi:hypothetical protein HZS_4292 [Henneguya salminicola]|nr:hypothetical protein HZS_4292 [Henneguya salminicola]